MRILVTNDDGILAEGIYAVAKTLKKVADEVIVVAPESEQSATGHSITLNRPLRVNKVKFFETDIEAYAVNGTPVDCVKLAVEAILKDRKPDLVVSGINNGPNLGTDVIYSGTVSAAVEAAILEIPSVAISMAGHKDISYAGAAEFACRIAKNIFQLHDRNETIINVNYPTIPEEEIKGVKITTLGIRKYTNAFEERKDPRGNSYYWVSGAVKEMEQKEESDISAIAGNYISITPIHFDLTHFETYKELKKIYSEI